eukprot:6212388-Pleurochrysis_carterae.AAC.1
MPAICRCPRRRQEACEIHRAHACLAAQATSPPQRITQREAVHDVPTPRRRERGRILCFSRLREDSDREEELSLAREDSSRERAAAVADPAEEGEQERELQSARAVAEASASREAVVAVQALRVHQLRVVRCSCCSETELQTLKSATKRRDSDDVSKETPDALVGSPAHYESKCANEGRAAASKRCASASQWNARGTTRRPVLAMARWRDFVPAKSIAIRAKHARQPLRQTRK